MPYALILLALLSIGCSSKKKELPSSEPAKTETRAEAPREPSSDSNAFPDVGAAPRIELRSAGEEPRRVLRWNFAEGAKYSLELRTYETMNVEMATQDEQMPTMANPPLVFELSIETRELTDDGSARVDFRVTHARAEKSNAVSEEELELAKKELSALRGLRGTYSVDARGVLSDIEFDRSSADASQAITEKISQMLRWTVVPLPQQEVGKGAQWTVKEVLLQEGVELRQLGTVELQKVDDSAIEVSAKLERTAGQQDLGAPGSAGGYELLQLKSVESLNTKANLSHLVPIASKATSHLEMATRVAGPDGAMQDVQISMKLEGSLRGAAATN